MRFVSTDKTCLPPLFWGAHRSNWPLTTRELSYTVHSLDLLETYVFMRFDDWRCRIFLILTVSGVASAAFASEGVSKESPPVLAWASSIQGDASLQFSVGGVDLSDTVDYNGIEVGIRIYPTEHVYLSALSETRKGDLATYRSNITLDSVRYGAGLTHDWELSTLPLSKFATHIELYRAKVDVESRVTVAGLGVVPIQTSETSSRLEATLSAQLNPRTAIHVGGSARIDDAARARSSHWMVTHDLSDSLTVAVTRRITDGGAGAVTASLREYAMSVAYGF